MYANLPYGELPLGDASSGPSDLIVCAGALGLAASAPPALAAIDSVVFPSAAAMAASAPTPKAAIDAVVFPAALSAPAQAPGPTIHAPLPISRLRDSGRAEPVYLVEIGLNNSGPVLYLSDRCISVPGQHYEDYIAEISGLEPGGGSRAAVRFKNDRFMSYGMLSDIAGEYPFEGAPVTVRECMLGAGGAPSEAATVLRGTLEAPGDIDPGGFTCKVRPAAQSKDRQWKQPVVDAASWPNAHEDLGEAEPFIYGSGLLVPALRVDWGARTTLASRIGASDTALELSDGTRFPASNFDLWIDDEKIHVSTRTGNSCAGLTRGYGGTAATAHRAGADAAEAKPQYDSLLASHELHSMGDVFAEIRGRLWRVASGVYPVLSGGRHLLRADGHIRVSSLEDALDGTTTAEKRTKQQGTPGTSFTLNNAGATGTFATFPSAAGANLYEYDLGYNFVMSYTLLTRFVVEAYPTGFPGDAVDVIDANGTTGLMTSMTTLKSPNHSTSITFRVKTDQGTNTSCTVYPMRAERTFMQTGAFNKTGGVYATHTVERFHAVVSGVKDPDGNYGGLGAVIERPDHVIKHFLVKRMGFSLDDIDSESFASSGAEFSGSGYAFAFRVGERIAPSDFLKRMARECRSALRNIRGKWKLHYFPDTAPEAVKKIAAGELAGEYAKFRFSRTPVDDLANDLTARFRRNYSRMGGDSAWDGTASVSDSASQSKYGACPKEVDFEFVRGTAMASNILSQILLEAKEPRLTVEFPVFWEHFDLEPGDTVEIENPLYGGRRFLIESVRRLDKFRAEIRGVEWW